MKRQLTFPGMKNYIANESGGWATSTGYVKFSLGRSIHFGRMYTSGALKGQEKDLYEALRCLGYVVEPGDTALTFTDKLSTLLRTTRLTQIILSWPCAS
jgi:hypothetical protein